VTTWVDSHCHLQMLDEAPEAVLQRAQAAGVDQFVCVGTDLTTSAAALELAAAHPSVRPTVGLHPHEARHLDAQWEPLLALAEAPGVVGIGETGFDLHYRHSPPPDQERSFVAHLRLAKRLGRALVIHCRDAWAETFDVLEREGPPERVVFHCFTGGPDEARRALGLGAFLSFSGIVTFRGAEAVRAAAAVTPAGRTLVETDAPFLAPVPHRGRRNEPAFLPRVGEGVAAAAGRPVEEVALGARAATAAVFGP
jgi:TatD DNase family protein